MRTTITTLFLAIITVSIASDQVPAPPQTHPILLMNATIHPVSAEEIQRGAIPVSYTHLTLPTILLL